MSKGPLYVDLRYLIDDYKKYFGEGNLPDLNTAKGRKNALTAFNVIINTKRGNNYASAKEYVRQLRRILYLGKIGDLYKKLKTTNDLSLEEMLLLSKALQDEDIQSYLRTNYPSEPSPEPESIQQARQVLNSNYQYNVPPLSLTTPIKNWDMPQEAPKPKVRKPKRRPSNKSTSPITSTDEGYKIKEFVVTPSERPYVWPTNTDPEAIYYDNSTGLMRGLNADFYVTRAQQSSNISVKEWRDAQAKMLSGNGAAIPDSTWVHLQQTGLNRPEILRRLRNANYKYLKSKIDNPDLPLEVRNQALQDLINITNYWDEHNLRYDIY